MLNHYTINVSDLCTKDSDYCMTDNELLLLSDILKNNRTKSSLNESESKLVDGLVKNNVTHILADKIKTRFPVFNEHENKEFSKYHDIVNEIYEGEAYDILMKCYNSIYEAVSKSLPDRFKKDSGVKTAMSVLESLICVLMRYAHKNGIIKIPEDDDKSAITMYMRF